ncbi:hypothetical protein KKF82_05450, partial [Patescibacteria group bacterium]|nr:hypothetical protein [Patescibacteria group bacterium]
MQPEDINITIGSDPEFVIMCGDKIENALEIFTRLQEPDYCCECPHPDIDDIENIYDGDKRYYIGEAINYFDTIDLITDYDDLAIDTLINAFEGKIEELLKIDKFKEVMLLY